MRKILIASVLKPVNDPRMYEKIAISMSRLEGVEVHVAGFKGSIDNQPPNLHPHALFNFRRLSLGRFLAPWKYYKLLLKVKPNIIIPTTHDLLIVSCIYKILFGGKIIYDVQENYYRNIAFTNTFPPLIRNLIAVWVRIKEWMTRPFVSHYLLAERNYEKEFSFSKGKSTIIENKTIRPTHIPKLKAVNPVNIKLLYSGTISENYGIFEAIHTAELLYEFDRRITLTIIGFSAKKDVLEEVKSRISPLDFIELKGGDQPVPHKEILKEIQSSDYGLLPYRPNKSTIHCIPTKLYEYMGYRLPMIVQHNPLWEEIVTEYNAGIMWDFTSIDARKLLELISDRLYYKVTTMEDIYWNSEEEKLLKVIKSYL